jgi:CTP synthase
MQLACIEAARNMAGINGRARPSSALAADPIVGLMTNGARQGGVERRHAGDDLGGTMRLGAYPCELAEGSLVRRIYGLP